MDFFRKYQRLILYTAGIFALVSFSISTPLQGFFDGLFRKEIATPTMRIGDRTIKITAEDQFIASRLSYRDKVFDSCIVLPPLVPSYAEEERTEVYAALRRLAIEQGLEWSDDDVDRAIEQAVAMDPRVNTPQALAAPYGSLADYRTLVGEAMRISTFARLQVLAVDTSDPALVDELLKDAELISLRVATLDEAAIQKEIETADVTDEALKTWIDGLDQGDRARRGFNDLPKFRVQFAYLLIGTFDPAQFTAELGDKEFSEEEVSQYYTANRARLYLIDPPAGEPAPEEPQYQPLDDERKADIQKRLRAEAVMRKLWDQVTLRIGESTKAEQDALDAARTAADEAQVARDLAAKSAELDGATEDQKAALVTAEAALTAANDARDAAAKALTEKSQAVDVGAIFTELAAGRAGLGVADSGDEMKTINDLQSVEPIAPWLGSAAVGALTKERPLSTQVQRSKQAIFQVRLLDSVLDALKPFADIREKARSDYFAEKASEAAEERATAFEKSLDELAKEKAAAEIAEAESKRDAKIEEELTAWRTATQGELEKARKTLADLGEDRKTRKVYIAAEANVQRLEAALADEATKRAAIAAELQTGTDDEIKTAKKKRYAEVLDTAAAQHGLTVGDFGPLPRDLSSRGGPKERFPKEVGYLWFAGQTRDLKEGEATDLLVDFVGKARYLALVTKVEKATLADLTRRQLLSARSSIAGRRLMDGMQQSFTLEALKQRYDWRAPDDVRAEPLQR